MEPSKDGSKEKKQFFFKTIPNKEYNSISKQCLKKDFIVCYMRKRLNKVLKREKLLCSLNPLVEINDSKCL